MAGIQEYRQAILQVLQKYPQISRVILFGSRAKACDRQGSDIDLALVGDGINHETMLQIHQELDDLLLPVAIDLMLLDEGTKPELAEHIGRVGIDWL